MIRRLAFLAALVAAAAPAAADEGMWTYNNFPADAVAKKYGFKPDQQWLDKVRLGSARLAQGCSASFVSKDGLVMTNHHCVHSCISQLSTPAKDLVKDGFLAKNRAEEKKCPNLEVNQLVEITDVTARITAATASKAGAAYAEAQKAEIAKVTKECATSDDVRCDVVTLYKGGKHDLYKYRRYQDVRLSWAPELGIAFFGGDPDNFNFPRYDLDAAFVRVYKDGKPIVAEHFLPFATTPAKAGDLTFVSGHPGHTSREYTVAELKFERDVSLPKRLQRLAEIRGRLIEFGNRGKEQARIAGSDLFGVENGYKALGGRHEALLDEKFFASKVKAQQDLIAAVRDPKMKGDLERAIADIDTALVNFKEFRTAWQQFEARQAFMSDSFTHARHLVRLADELPKANEARLKEYSDAALPGVKSALASPAPIFKDLETLKLAFSLSKMRELLTTDDPVVRKVLGAQSPEALAAALVKGTKLADPKARKVLVDAVLAGNRKPIDDSKDPMIVLARLIDADARALRTRYENEVESVIDRANETIAKARFAVYGTSVYPDATFTLRLSFGTIAGWKERGADVNPVTVVGGAFERHTGAKPYDLPASWLKARSALNPSTPMNISTTNDIIGGNSGSPVVNKDGQVIGLIFDGNIHSLGGEYGFNADTNRAVAVHSAVILEALQKVYGAKHLVDELMPTPAPAAPAAPTK
jgi:V8-like Glu-specific endopeptidase